MADRVWNHKRKGMVIDMDLYPLKAQYLSNEEVLLCLEQTEVCERERYNRAVVHVYCLEREVRTVEAARLEPETKISIGRYDVLFAGFGVRAVIYGAGDELVLETAFDVCKEPGKSLRYGFVSDFTAKDKTNGAMEQLRKYHINMVQFYDWSYRHDSLVSEAEDYEDMMGKPIHSETVREKIAQAERYGMQAIAYGAVYAASKEFYDQHQELAFYNANGEVFRFIDRFYIMNIQKGSPWRRHLTGQYRDAMEKMGFTGIHMDTYGFPKTAFSRLEGDYTRVSLQKEFGSLIDETYRELAKTGREPYLLFNNVGNWPVAETARHEVKAVYIEVWPPYERYHHIKQLILEAKQLVQNQKPVILAAYLEPFRKESPERAACCARILTAVMVTNGAYHLLLGEKNGVLTQGYYGDYSVMEEKTAAEMRRYYDFMVRYLHLFYDAQLVDVTMTHMGWDNYEYQCSAENWSAYGESGKLWLTVRESEAYKLLSYINLCGCQEDYWNKGKEMPVAQKDIVCTVAVDGEIEGIYYASPDLPDSESYRLPYEYLTDEKGKYVRYVLPEVVVWAIVYMRGKL